MKVYTFTDEDVSSCGGVMFAAVYRSLASLIEGEAAWEEATGKCGDDSLYEDGYGPLCEDCHESLAISSLGGGRDEEEEN